MSKLIVHNLVSLDGFYEGANNNIGGIWDYHHADYSNDISFHEYNAELLRKAGTLLLGAKTSNGFNEHWKSVLNDPNASEIAKKLAKLIVPLEKLVISDSLTSNESYEEDNTKIISRANAKKILSDIKNNSEKHIIILGSHVVWQYLLTLQLVDEIHITVAPVFSGSGTPLFTFQPGIYLKKIGTFVPDNSGNVIIKYKVSYDQ